MYQERSHEKRTAVISKGNCLYGPAKRMLDLIGAFVGMLVFVLLYIPVAILIKLDSPGPVLFAQERLGKDGKVFTMYKFRSMYADSLKFDFKPMSDADNRVTRVGRFLRRTSIDEIPQFINVIRGEMSLVGPRPELAFIVEQFEPWQRERLTVLPGITGWWQVNGRKQPMHKHIEYDIYYIKNRSLLLDLKILLMTIGAVISGKGAI